MLHAQTPLELPGAPLLLGPELLVPLRSPQAPSQQHRPRPGAVWRMLPPRGEDRSSFWFCFRFRSAERVWRTTAGTRCRWVRGTCDSPKPPTPPRYLSHRVLQTLPASHPPLRQPGQDLPGGPRGTAPQSGTRGGINRKGRPWGPGVGGTSGRGRGATFRARCVPRSPPRHKGSGPPTSPKQFLAPKNTRVMVMRRSMVVCTGDRRRGSAAERIFSVLRHSAAWARRHERAAAGADVGAGAKLILWVEN